MSASSPLCPCDIGHGKSSDKIEKKSSQNEYKQWSDISQSGSMLKFRFCQWKVANDNNDFMSSAKEALSAKPKAKRQILYIQNQFLWQVSDENI